MTVILTVLTSIQFVMTCIMMSISSEFIIMSDELKKIRRVLRGNTDDGK